MPRTRQRSRGHRNPVQTQRTRLLDCPVVCARRPAPGTIDRDHRQGRAERILAKRIADAALRKDGVVDARADRFTAAERRPLAAHLADWKAALTAKGVTPKHVLLLQTRATSLLGAVGAERPRRSVGIRDPDGDRRPS